MLEFAFGVMTLMALAATFRAVAMSQITGRKADDGRGLRFFFL